MTAAFTPGPWEISTLDGRTIGPVTYTHTDPEVRQFELPKMQAVAVVKERIGVTEANAKLIAAAPELLAALKAMLRPPAWLRRESDDYAEPVRLAHAAIAKAGG